MGLPVHLKAAVIADLAAFSNAPFVASTEVERPGKELSTQLSASILSWQRKIEQKAKKKTASKGYIVIKAPLSEAVRH